MNDRFPDVMRPPFSPGMEPGCPWLAVGPVVAKLLRLQQSIERLGKLLAMGHGTGIVGDCNSSVLSQPWPAAIQRRPKRRSTGTSQGAIACKYRGKLARKEKIFR